MEIRKLTGGYESHVFEGSKGGADFVLELGEDRGVTQEIVGATGQESGGGFGACYDKNGGIGDDLAM